MFFVCSNFVCDLGRILHKENGLPLAVKFIRLQKAGQNLPSFVTNSVNTNTNVQHLQIAFFAHKRVCFPLAYPVTKIDIFRNVR